jgi:hypothetical protein
LGGTYSTGGRPTVNGVWRDSEQANTRAGFTLGIPVDRQLYLRFGERELEAGYANDAYCTLRLVVPMPTWEDSPLTRYANVSDPVADAGHFLPGRTEHGAQLLIRPQSRAASSA